MKRLSIAAVLVVCLALSSWVPAQQVESDQFWIPANLRWNHPRGAPQGETVAPVMVLYFGRNGVFVRDECLIIRQRTTITISNGDPHTEWVGSWEPIAHGRRLKYRLVERTVEIKGERLPGDEVVAIAEVLQSGLKMGGQLFRSAMPSNSAEYAAEYNALVRANAESN